MLQLVRNSFVLYCELSTRLTIQYIWISGSERCSLYSWFGSTSPSGQLLPGSPVSGHCFQGRWKWRSHLKGGSSGDQGDLSPALNFQHSSKIPTVILYDTTGTARAFGAEAESEDKQEEAFKGGWKEAKYFKLKLHPATIQSPVTMGLRGGRTLVVGPVIPFGVRFFVRSLA